jgi:hypothetical protein
MKKGLYEGLKNESQVEVKPFIANSGWFESFRVQDGFHNLKENLCRKCERCPVLMMKNYHTNDC